MERFVTCQFEHPYGLKILKLWCTKSQQRNFEFNCIRCLKTYIKSWYWIKSNVLFPIAWSIIMGGKTLGILVFGMFSTCDINIITLKSIQRYPTHEVSRCRPLNFISYLYIWMVFSISFLTQDTITTKIIHWQT